MGDSDWGRWQVLIGFISLIIAFVGLFYGVPNFNNDISNSINNNINNDINNSINHDTDNLDNSLTLNQKQTSPEKSTPTPSEIHEPGTIIQAQLVGYNDLASNFLDSSEGVLASDHYLRGKLSYPITVARPENGLLQVAFQSVNPSDDWIRINGIVRFDGSKINKVHIKTAVIDENGKSTSIGSKEVDSSGAFTIDVRRELMIGDPQKIVFDISYDAADGGKTIIAKLVNSNELSSNFLDSPKGVLATDHYMRGKLSYPFTVVSPNELLQVAFQSVDPSDDWIRITGIVPPFDESKINKLHIKTAVIDENGKSTSIGSKEIDSSGTFTIDVRRELMTGDPQEIAFDISYDAVGGGNT